MQELKQIINLQKWTINPFNVLYFNYFVFPILDLSKMLFGCFIFITFSSVLTSNTELLKSNSDTTLFSSLFYMFIAFN